MKKISAMLLTLFLALFLVSCKKEPIPEPEVITYNITFLIEDKTHNVKVNNGDKIKKEDIPNTDKLSFEFIGWFTGDEKVNLNDYVVTKDVTFTAKYKDLLVSVVFEDKTVVFNETVQSLVVSNLPTGYTVEYLNNNNINAGTYEVTATILLKTVKVKTLKASITIVPQDLELTLVDKEFKFDGEAKKLNEIMNLKDNMNIIYVDNDKHIFPGVYKVGAIVNGNDLNYKYNKSLLGTLKIYYEVNFHNKDGIKTVKNFNTWLENHDINTKYEGYIFKGFYTDSNFTKEVKDKEYLNDHTDIYMKYEKVGA